MRRIYAQLLTGRERGQAMILVAVMGTTLMFTAGLAIEGGNVMVNYRAMQSAADVAALTAAQDLPCKSTDTTCISTAEQDGCNSAQTNGFGAGWSGGTCQSSTGQTVSVSSPPTSCSPYNFIDYGNGDASCGSTAASSYSYAETTIQQTLTIPIFNKTVTLSSHAVARRNGSLNGAFALIGLDPTTPITLQGNSTTEVTGSVFGNGGVTDQGSANATTCGGGWYSPDSISSNVSTNNTGTITFSPPGCSGSDDTTPLTDSHMPTLADPFSGSVAPPASYPNCTPCSSTGIWYDLKDGSWHTNGSITTSDDVELFPGVYDGLSLGDSQKAYFNPGVYTFNAGFDTNHGKMCVYGSPSCNDGSQINDTSCATASFSSGSPAGDQWNYQCSPYGYWDSTLVASATAAIRTALGTSGPTWWDTTLNAGEGGASTDPLNGVTFNLPGTVTLHGNGGKNGDIYLSAPNPCPGTGTYTIDSAVSFPVGSTSGDPTGNYNPTYTTANDGLPHGNPSAAQAAWVYPNADWSASAECADAKKYLVWPGEMVSPQHLHFLFYMPNAGTASLNGASGQQFTGIFYAPLTSMTINGAGKGAGGPPWISGQLIADDLTFSGNNTIDIPYRTCTVGTTSCGSGYGTSLVE